MSNQLETAIEKLSKLPEREQNVMARWIVEEINSDKRWDELFADSEDQLKALAEEALNDFDKDKTEKLDVNKL